MLLDASDIEDIAPGVPIRPDEVSALKGGKVREICGIPSPAVVITGGALAEYLGGEPLSFTVTTAVQAFESNADADEALSNARERSEGCSETFTDSDGETWLPVPVGDGVSVPAEAATLAVRDTSSGLMATSVNVTKGKLFYTVQTRNGATASSSLTDAQIGELVTAGIDKFEATAP